jgi:cupin 2 domain-containing protein
MRNLFANLPSGLPEELVEILVDSRHIRIERIVSHGHSSPANFWYDQVEDEWIVVLKGQARLLLEGDHEPVELRPGDFINIPAHKRHRVEWTTTEEQTVWLAVFYHAD